MPDEAGFGLYVHWPFCQAKCPYCDFNSHVVANVDQSDWASAFEIEIARVRELTGSRTLNSIFFGGGTPSLMHVKTVERIIAKAQAAWQFANDIEITLEANPTSSEAAKFQDFKSVGVNRVSVGVQALNDDDLRRLGRLHSAAEGLRAFDAANRIFDYASFDLIYARQDQSLSDWEAELAQALNVGAEHMSLYQLTIEPETAFGDRFKRGTLRGLPTEDVATDMFALTQDMTTVAALPAYEISNHARAGAKSKHNLIYWRSGDWAGVGPGSHGRITVDGHRIATEAKSAPGAWLTDVKKGQSPETRVTLSEGEVFEERLMFGLRLTEGVEISNISFGEKINYINGLGDFALLRPTEKQLELTPEGRPLLNAVLRELLT